jgi:hypothetical protein
MKIVISNELYDIPNGIGLLKTLYGENYKNLPEEFKHKDLKKSWKEYKGIPKNLYLMSKSTDLETIELAVKLLEKENIKYYNNFKNVYNLGSFTKELNNIKVFLTIKEIQWNNYK